jgi:hypothetical protein
VFHVECLEVEEAVHRILHDIVDVCKPTTGSTSLGTHVRARR